MPGRNFTAENKSGQQRRQPGRGSQRKPKTKNQNKVCQRTDPRKTTQNSAGTERTSVEPTQSREKREKGAAAKIPPIVDRESVA